uniref:Uncharacterized protein n=1 Tax=Sipha flava TaxID=143950 RepID=A0A2S2QN16_9HEMI
MGSDIEMFYCTTRLSQWQLGRLPSAQYLLRSIVSTFKVFEKPQVSAVGQLTSRNVPLCPHTRSYATPVRLSRTILYDDVTGNRSQNQPERIRREDRCCDRTRPEQGRGASHQQRAQSFKCDAVISHRRPNAAGSDG